MNIDKMIEQWEEKHSSLLNDYSKGNANNEVMQMYRSQMKNVLDFINQLKQVKNISSNTMLAVTSDSEENKKESAVAVAFADWMIKKIIEIYDIERKWVIMEGERMYTYTSEQMYKMFEEETAKETDR